MDLHYNRLKIIFLILALFISCDSQIEDTYDIPSNFYDDSIAAFYNHYDGANHILSVYLEFLDSTHNVDSIIVNIAHSNIDTSLYEFELSNLSEVNSKAFIYEEFLLDSINQPILSNNIYLYDMIINILFLDSTNYQFSSDLTTAIAPEILSHDVPQIFTLHPTEWDSLLINLEVKDLNGANNIEAVKYEIKKIVLEGCDECPLDPDDCEPEIDEDYSSDPTWKFDYIESLSDSIHAYQAIILMRPANGGGLYDDGICNNIDPEDEFCDGFEEKDCGRIGVVEFKLIVDDNDNLSYELDEIFMEIIK